MRQRSPSYGVYGLVVLLALATTMTRPLAAQGRDTAAAGRKQGGAVSQPAGDDSAANAAAEQARYYSALMGMRKQLLARSGWAPLGDECNPGALRVFGTDTTPALRSATQSTLDRMEEIIALFGAGHAVDDADGRSLVRVIAEWEANISRPHWDADDGVPRTAFAAGLTGEYPNPTGKGCLSAPQRSDTVMFWLPALSDIKLGATRTAVPKVYFGADGKRRARDEFVRVHGGDTASVLEVIEVAPVVRWRDWAAVAVHRTLSDRGIALGQPGKGGAVYLLRRVENEWRLVAVTRSWGS